ncbi:PTS system galactitol-specific IIC component [Anaerosolibacter carboniphilus]|uniref:PTS system galactitol-specific IIC component n=1 Tax=Anaerosolibacter carboniphilus TaxID=1417629 RepID=A0A841KUT7_9FIRM|nr:PTS transporter subunit IIC [Anaerosolibacter carboniphilus]MBB6217416.1 PTS system galactitol-specific IIC component [Anaerosolibacter carboniphilus]
MAVLDYIVNLGAQVMMPIIITVFALLLGAKFGKSLRAGLTVGVGFVGLNMVIGLLGGNLGPAAQEMVHKLGLELTVIDVGWPAAAAIAFASKVGALIIPIGLAINVIMLLTNTTQTVNIDIWNYWHFAFTGALVAGATNSTTWGLVAAGLNMIIVMVIADLTAPGVEKYNGLPGVSLPHGFSGAYVPIAIILNKILDYIPGINKVNLDAEKLQKRFGLFGEPILMGTIIGLLIGIGAGYDLKGILTLGIILGSVLVLIPKMAAMLMEGLIPVSDAAQEFIEKRFKNRGKVYIGLDSAVGIGHPVGLSVSLALVPITILLAAVIPGNKVLPFADLAVIPFMLVMVVPVTRGNVLRTFIIGFLTVAVGLLIATNLAPLFTDMAVNANFQMPDGATMISSICDGANPLSWAFTKIMGLKAAGAGILTVIALGMAVYNRQRIIKENSQVEA